MSEILSSSQPDENQRSFEFNIEGGIKYKPTRPIIGDKAGDIISVLDLSEILSLDSDSTPTHFKGQMSLDIAEVDLLSANKTSIKEKTKLLILGPENLGLSSQAIIMKDFWHIFGLETPEIPESVKLNFVKEFGGTAARLIPVPFLTLSQRKALYKTSNTYLAGHLTSNIDFQMSDDYSTIYSELMRKPSEGVVEIDNQYYGLKYSVNFEDNHYLMDRTTYIKFLEATGMAIRSNDGSLWSFFPMNFQDRLSVEEYTDLASANYQPLSPESLITEQLLKLASGERLIWNPRSANEEVYLINTENNSVKELIGRATLLWYNKTKTGHMVLSRPKLNNDSDH